MEKVNEIVDKAYRAVTKIGKFDIEKGNAPIPAVWDEKMSTIPDLMKEYVDDCGYGCCFVFSAYMISILEKNNINSSMICTIEDTGLRASVLYENDGELFVANPVEDIEYFTDNNILPADRASYYVGDTSEMSVYGINHNGSCYTLDEFAEKYGQVWLLGKMDKNSTQTLSEAMATREERCIMPPETANYNYKKAIK